MRSLRILLVEDNPDHAMLVERSIAESEGAAQVTVVTDGEEALSYLRRKGAWSGPAERRRPHLILLDLRLPRLDGFHVLRTIKDSPELRAIPVVVLTTSEATSDVSKAYELHANSYLVKPVDFDRFVALMRDVESYWLGWNQGRQDGP